MTGRPKDPAARDARIRAARRAAPRDRLVRGSLTGLAVACAAVWLTGPFAVVELFADGGPQVPGPALTDAFSERRLANLRRFAGTLAPQPGPEHDGLGDWLWELVVVRGLPAMATTLAVAVAAATLAALIAFPLIGFGARTLVDPEPFGVRSGRPCGRWARRASAVLASGVRLLLLALRAVPEYLLAFVLVVLGPGAWPAVLALAVHNAGALGRLGSEVVENLPAGPARSARAAGATRLQIGSLVLWPAALPSLLVFFFYRTESCIRESIVLGMLGVGTLGYLIQNDARARLCYDEMAVYLALGLVLVLAGDLVSARVRRHLREHAH